MFRQDFQNRLEKLVNYYQAEWAVFVVRSTNALNVWITNQKLYFSCTGACLWSTKQLNVFLFNDFVYSPACLY